MMQILQAQVCGCISAQPGWWRSQPKIFWGPTKYGGTEYFILGEQQHFVWGTSCQSKKLRDILKMWGAPRAPGPSWLHLWKPPLKAQND